MGLETWKAVTWFVRVLVMSESSPDRFANTEQFRAFVQRGDTDAPQASSLSPVVIWGIVGALALLVLAIVVITLVA